MIPYGFSLRPVVKVGDPNRKMTWEEVAGCTFCAILCAGQVVMTIMMVIERFH